MRRRAARVLVLAVVYLAVLAIAVITALAGAADGAVTPGAGVETYNKPVCGQGYAPIDMGRGDYFNVYNATDGSTCVTAEKHHLNWYVTSATGTALWGDPNISVGIQWGKYTCDDGRSASPSSPGSQCMRFPVVEHDDGTPVAGIERFWPHLAVGNDSFDIWFNKEDVAPSKLRQNDGAEIMIWLQHPGLPVRDVLWTTTIGGVRYQVMGARVTLNGKSWNRLDYVAVHPQSSFAPTRLNQFFRNAIAHGELKSTWFLTDVSFGQEIARVNPGGYGISVEGFYVGGVR